MYRLLLMDLDGTLLDSQKRISDDTLGVLAQCRQKGISIGVATARSELTARPFLEWIQPDVVISNSGALVRLGEQVLFSCSFTKEETMRLIRAGLAEGRGITVDSLHASYSNRTIDQPSWDDVTITDYADFDDIAFKLCIEGSDRTFAERTAALVEDCECVPFSDCDWFKYAKAGASKEKGILPVQQALGIAAEEIIAFGDDYIDLGMLRYCGLGVAMGNAIDEVKQVADAVTLDCDSDGVAVYLQHHIL